MLAAHRVGIHHVLPRINEDGLVDLPEHVRVATEVHLAQRLG